MPSKASRAYFKSSRKLGLPSFTSSPVSREEFRRLAWMRGALDVTPRRTPPLDPGVCQRAPRPGAAVSGVKPQILPRDWNLPVTSSHGQVDRITNLNSGMLSQVKILRRIPGSVDRVDCILADVSSFQCFQLSAFRNHQDANETCKAARCILLLCRPAAFPCRKRGLSHWQP